MRATTDLLEQPFVFTQLRLLAGDEFRSEAGKRGVHFTEETLEALHRLRVLVPFFRVRRDRAAIGRALRRDENHLAHRLSSWRPTARSDLVNADRQGRLADPGAERFSSAHRRRLALDEQLSYTPNLFLYSHHQLVSLPIVERALRWLKWRSTPADPYLDVGPVTKRLLKTQALRLRQVAIATTVLEPVHYPVIVGSLSLSRQEEFGAFDRWHRSLTSMTLLRWLGIDSDWLDQNARELLLNADTANELGSFAELVAAADAASWQELRGRARNVIDLRLTAEILLRQRDQLVRARKATPLPRPLGRMSTPYDLRLARRRSIDALLERHGLSAHPNLVLVVEGKTERVLLPRVLAKLGLTFEDDFIRIHDAEGVDRDLGPLAGYIAPKLVPDLDERYVRFERPPTRLHVVVDPEGKANTAQAREEIRSKLVERMMRALPEQLNTEVVRAQLDPLVTVTTWTSRDESFEFAHFTDRELAIAIDELDRRARKPPLAQRVQAIANVRRDNGNLKKTVLRGVAGKRLLADHLWPMLERKLDRGIERDAATRIPIVRVIDEALNLAHEFSRGSWVVALEREPAQG